jgi:hypothetical protein
MISRRGKDILASRSIVLFCLATAFATAVIVGCGGGDDSSSSGEGALAAKERFIEEANKICEQDKSKVPEQFTAYLKQHQGDGSKEEVFAGMIKTVLLPVIAEDISKLKELDAPPEDKSEIEEFLRLQQKAVVAMAKLKRLSEGPAGERYLEPPSRIAKAYGIKVCAQS